MTMLVMRDVTKSGTRRRRQRPVRTGPGSIPFVTTTQAIGSSVTASRRSRAMPAGRVFRKANSVSPRTWTRVGHRKLREGIKALASDARGKSLQEGKLAFTENLDAIRLHV